MSMNSIGNKRIARNTLFLYIRMFLVLIVSLYTSRVVLNTLGVADFGVYNVVAGFVSLFGFFNATLSSSMQRFYNYEIGRSGESGVAKVYVTGFYTHLTIAAIVLVLLESFGLWYVNHVMVIPGDRLFAANVLFQVSAVSMTLVIIQIPYLGIIMAYEKMDYYAFVTILDVFLKLAIVLILPFVPFDKLILYAFLYLIVAVCDFLLYFVYSKLKIKAVSEKAKFDKEVMKSIATFSGWNLMGTFAFMMKGQGLNMTLNYFFGPIINAARGVAFQVQSAVSGFSSNVSTAFRPQLVSSYAEGNISRSVRLMFVQSKVCFILIGLLITPLAFEIDLVLHLWLGDIVPQYTSIFSVLTLIDLLICTLNTPCTQIVFASGDVKNYQIGSTAVNLLLVPTAIIVLKAGGSPTSIFWLTIVFSIINQIVCLFWAERIIHFGIRDYVRNVLVPCLLFSILLPILPWFITLVLPDSFGRLILECIISIFVASTLGLFVVLRKVERNILLNQLKAVLKSQKKV